jgi:hypothetical protein
MNEPFETESPKTTTGEATRPREATRFGWLAEAHKSDFFTIGVLVFFVMIALWIRFRYDNWLGEFDILTMFIPWFGYIGDRLADFEIPAWSPHYFGGAPVAGNPSGGWMYLQVMLLYPIFEILTATKLLLLTHAVIASAATYAFSRRIGLAPLAALMSTSIFVLGQIIYGATNYTTIGVQASTWLIVGLLATEMALTAKRMPAVLGWTALGGVALSQIVAAWPGQGILYAMMWIGAWLLYRSFFDANRFLPQRADRFWHAVLTGSVMTFLGLAFSAAQVLPMLDFLSESTIPNGDYSNVVGGDYVSDTPGLISLLAMFLHGTRNPDFSVLSQAFGMSVMLLAIFGTLFARRQYAAMFFAAMFVGAIALMVDYSPFLWLFNQIPLIGPLHEHRPTGLSWMIAIAPAMLAGAAVQKQLDRDIRKFTFNQMFGFVLLFIMMLATYYSEKLWAGYWPLLSGAAVLFLFFLPSIDSRRLKRRFTREQLSVVVSWGLIAVVFFYPTFTETVRTIWQPETDVGGVSITPGKEPASTWAINTNVARTDPGSAAEFLQRQQAALGFFRYTGYAGQGYPDPQWVGQLNEGHKSAYSWRRMQPGVVGILVNARTMRLGLYQTGGYNPVQLRYYTEYFDVMNGRRQDYHWLDTFAPALGGSQLLDMLNVRYIVVDASIPDYRGDFFMIDTEHTEVFRDSLAIVYENESAFPHAWIVHDVQDNGPTGYGLRMLASGNTDGHITAYVNIDEGEPLPSVSVPADGGRSDKATLVRYAPESMTIATSSTADGFLVVSDPYASGWNAYIDGEKTEIIRTNHALRGIALPAGEHTVEIRYEPRSLEVGMIVTGSAAVAMIGVWAWALVDWIRRRGTTSGTISPATPRDPNLPNRTRRLFARTRGES